MVEKSEVGSGMVEKRMGLRFDPERSRGGGQFPPPVVRRMLRRSSASSLASRSKCTLPVKCLLAFCG